MPAIELKDIWHPFGIISILSLGLNAAAIDLNTGAVNAASAGLLIAFNIVFFLYYLFVISFVLYRTLPPTKAIERGVRYGRLLAMLMGLISTIYATAHGYLADVGQCRSFERSAAIVCSCMSAGGILSWILSGFLYLVYISIFIVVYLAGIPQEVETQRTEVEGHSGSK